jgi:hypothetical protein
VTDRDHLRRLGGVTHAEPELRLARGSNTSPLPKRPILRHPHADRTTQRMPFAQLRELVIAAMDDEAREAAREFDEAAQTTFRPPVSRTATIDALIASLPKSTY